MDANPDQWRKERTYRQAIGEPDWATRPGVLGVALSGGGSKAAPFALGVLAGLHDEGLLLPATGDAAAHDVIVSSVSGGGYAAYHLFSQLLHSRQQGRSASGSLRAAYADCAVVHKTFSSGLRAALGDAGCDEHMASTTWPLHSEQAKLRCAQDLLQPGECSYAHRSSDVASTAFGVFLVSVPTALSVAAHHLLNTVFDTGISVSPSRFVYRSGIGVSYGSVAQADADRRPGDNRGLLNCPDATGSFETSLRPRFGESRSKLLAPRIDQCETINFPQGSAYLLPRDWDFAELARLREGPRPGAPLWVIQATATRFRSVWGWTAGQERDIALDTFEITPHGFGSLRYGFAKGSLPGMSVLDATVSAAAFLDANQQEYHTPLKKTVFGVFQHAFNLNWGLDIPNYNVSEGRRQLHRVLPLPLHWLDAGFVHVTEQASEARQDRYRSAFIRLIDGGSSDNTGAYSLLRRGVKTIVISDAAQDSDGTFADLCRLRVALAKAHPPLQLHLPGLQGFDDSCASNEPPRWDLFGTWGHELPALLGCVTSGDNCDEPERAVARLVVLKPRVEWSLRKAEPGMRNGLEHAVRWKDGTANQCVHAGVLHSAESAGSISCGGRLAPGSAAAAACARALPCESATLLLNEPSEDRLAAVRDSGFPQTSTILTTLNSSGTLFAASRELARHYTRLSTGVILDSLHNNGRGWFREMLGQQRGAPTAKQVRRTVQ